MKITLIVGLLFTSLTAFADQICSDGFRQIRLNQAQPLVELNGFEFSGIASGSQYRCQAVEKSGNDWFAASRVICSNGSSAIVLRAVESGGVASVQLLNAWDFPIFAGICKN